MTAESKHRRSADHIWHVWMNQFSDIERTSGREFPHSLYEFKSLLEFLSYGDSIIAKAFTGKLATTHQQCSRTAPEPIEGNCATCCLGKEVTSCEILVSIKSTFDSERERECGVLGKHYAGVPDSEMYRVMAQTCAWHIYKTVVDGKEGWHGVDTSEGHILTKSDRMFWDRVYSSMSANLDEGNDQ